MLFQKRFRPVPLFLAFPLVFALFLGSYGLFASQAFGQQPAPSQKGQSVSWELFTSESSVFSVRFPESYKYKSYVINVGDTALSYAEEILGEVPSDIDVDDGDKVYFVKMNQTLGSTIPLYEAKKLLDDEVAYYKDFAKQNNGLLVSNEDVKIRGFLGKDFFVTYPDPDQSINTEKTKKAMRVRVLMTNTAKIQMIITGNNSGMYSYKANNFFDSIRLSDGFGQKPKDYTDKRKVFDGPNNIFSIVIPPRNIEYRPDRPRYKVSKQISSAHVVFNDPVLHQKVFYNVYAYKIGREVTDKIVSKLIFSRHVSRFVDGAMEDNLKVSIEDKDDYRVMSTQLVIEPKPELPYLNCIYIYAIYKGDTLVIQEVAGSQGSAFGGFANTLVTSLKFHPEKYKEATRDEILKRNKAYQDEQKAKEAQKATDAKK